MSVAVRYTRIVTPETDGDKLRIQDPKINQAGFHDSDTVKISHWSICRFLRNGGFQERDHLGSMAETRCSRKGWGESTSGSPTGCLKVQGFSYMWTKTLPDPDAPTVWYVFIHITIEINRTCRYKSTYTWMVWGLMYKFRDVTTVANGLCSPCQWTLSTSWFHELLQENSPGRQVSTFCL